MQILILGMHRSGTSALTRLINMMGAYTFPESMSLGASEQNPKGFWERRDITDCNDRLLIESGYTWDGVGEFSLTKLDKQRVATYQQDIKKIILDMDAHRPWVIKDPRLCLLLPLWQPILEMPVAIHIVRNPLEVAQSLKHRNQVPIDAGIALWEVYNRLALSHFNSMPRIFTSYDDIMTDPGGQVASIFKQLEKFNVNGLRLPSESEVSAFISKKLKRQHAGDNTLNSVLNARQAKLYKQLKNQSVRSEKNTVTISEGASIALSAYQSSKEQQARLDGERQQLLKDNRQVINQNNALKQQKDSLFQEKQTLSNENQSLRESLAQTSLALTAAKEGVQQEKAVVVHLYSLFKQVFESKTWRIGRLINKWFHVLRLRQPVNSIETDVLAHENHYRETHPASDAQVQTARARRVRPEQLVSQLLESADGILQSRTWRVGRAINRLAHRLTLRTLPQTAERDIQSIKQAFQQSRAPAGEGIRGQHRFVSSRSAGVACPACVAIVVYAQGDLTNLRRCLRSLAEHSDLKTNTVYVIDGSAIDGMQSLIDRWMPDVSLQLYKQPAHESLLESLRQMAVSRYDFCLVHDSVTLTPGWLESLKRAAYSSANVALVSPLTNAHPGYELSLQEGDSIFTCAQKIALVSMQQYPETQLVDPNIFYRRQDAGPLRAGRSNEAATYEDEVATLCWQLQAADRTLVIADDTFVHVSFRQRRTYSPASYARMPQSPAGADHTAENGDYPPLEIDAVSDYANTELRITRPNTVAIIFSSMMLRGGVLVLTELVNDLILKGLDVKVVLMHPPSTLDLKYDLLFAPINSKNADRIHALLPRHTHVVATFWATVDLAKDLLRRDPTKRGYYFIQDYEPSFYDPDKPEETANHQGAKATYTTDLHFICTSAWIRERILAQLNTERRIDKINVGINLEVFRPAITPARDHPPRHAPVRIIAMTRPQTPRRGYELLIDALNHLAADRSGVEIFFFGTPDINDKTIRFEFENLGCLDAWRLQREYRRADIFIDSSCFQGFGLAPLEAMACGCACVLTDSGGINEYAVHQHNALIVENNRPAALAGAIETLLDDQALRRSLAANAVSTAEHFSHHHLANAMQAYFTRPPEPESSPVDKATPPCAIIIPVYNEIGTVKYCLNSVLAHTSAPYRAIIVDDGSDHYTRQWLENFAARNPSFEYLRNRSNIGFVASVNRGMQHAGAADKLLLNSDTLVTPNWLEKLQACAASDASIGIISPLSTRSSHLWVKMNPGDSVFDTATAIEKLSTKSYPDIVTPEGWCFYIKQAVYDLLGGFDETFGKGYCEESDYCMRAQVSGFRTVCCDDTFIFHEGMVTFKAEKSDRYRINRAIFDRRWQRLYAKVYQQFLTADPLAVIRQRYRQQKPPAFQTLASRENAPGLVPLSILTDEAALQDIATYENTRATRAPAPAIKNPAYIFIVSKLNNSGGVLSIISLINDLVMLGENVKVIVLDPDEAFDSALWVQPVYFKSQQELLDNVPGNAIIIGTLWITMYYVIRLCQADPSKIPAYFIQDFEPDFYPDPDLRDAARRTYGWTANCMAKTNWIIEKVAGVGGHVHHIPPAVDTDLFYRHDGPGRATDKKIILTMFRPATPWRGLKRALAVLTALSRQRDDIEIHGFGCTDDALAELAPGFAVVNHGVVNNNALPAIYSQADVFLETSDFHGFGRTIVEAMACQTACVITASGGVREFAIDNENCLLSPVADTAKIIENINTLLDTPALRERLAANARKTIEDYDRLKSARATQKLLQSMAGEGREDCE